MAEKETKVTIMVLKVDLESHKSYKKVKKVLCKFPQIRDQIYDEKQNLVTIRVVCFSPEKIREKLCCKGGGAIKSIEIKEPPKLKPSKKSKNPKKTEGSEKLEDSEKSEDSEKLEDPSKTKNAETDQVPFNTCCSDCYHGNSGGPCYNGHGTRIPTRSVPFNTCCSNCFHRTPGGPCYNGNGSQVPTLPVPFNTCCSDCFHGHPGGPCPYVQYDGYCERPVYNSYGGGVLGNCVTLSQCFSEENPHNCTIM